MFTAAPACVLAHDDAEPANVLAFQPAIPFRLIDRWNVITPTIGPLIYQLELASDVGGPFRLGDIEPSLFLSPSEPDAIFRLSAATGDVPGADTWDIRSTLAGYGAMREGAATRDESGAVVPSAAGESEDFDPWERFNAKTFEINRRLDKYALKPVAKGWKTVVPERAGIMISNAFDNLTVVPRVVNNVLQGKWDGAGRELSRFLINSTAGVGGLFDPAKDVWHITNSPADFGQTLGRWGVEPGPYLVLPFMEPVTVRDGIGKLVDRAMDPLTYLVPLVPALILVAGNRVNERALNYDLFEGFDDSVIDAYAAVRNGYLQRRDRMLKD